MHEYRARTSDSSMSESPAREIGFPTPAVKGGSTSTRFSIKQPEFKIDSRATTVKAEFDDYSSHKSSKGCDVLRFWEVSDFMKVSRLNSVTAHSLNRIIKVNIRHFSRSRWTTFQFRQRRCLVSAFSLQQRRQTLPNGTRSTRFSWKPFKC